MTRPADIPSDTRARRILDQYLTDCQAAGRRPSVLGLAAQLDLTNTTFRRHFPYLANEISAARTKPTGTTGPNRPPSSHDTLLARNAKLRRANRNLTDHLRLAAAHIQRLTLDNAQLHEALQADSKITRIGRPNHPRNRRTPPGPQRGGPE
jgi:predicted ArsR family transcriptional regulator